MLISNSDPPAFSFQVLDLPVLGLSFDTVLQFECAKAPDRFICLDIWSQNGATVWGGYGNLTGGNGSLPMGWIAWLHSLSVFCFLFHRDARGDFIFCFSPEKSNVSFPLYKKHRHFQKLPVVKARVSLSLGDSRFDSVIVNQNKLEEVPKTRQASFHQKSSTCQFLRDLWAVISELMPSEMSLILRLTVTPSPYHLRHLAPNPRFLLFFSSQIHPPIIFYSGNLGLNYTHSDIP
ncbi:hypothetical protein STEG23_028312, partial [Scotinomys teguina]